MDTHIDTVIDIAAPPSVVWATLIEVERFPEWNPFVHRIQGELREGARLTVVLGERQMTFRPRVVAFEPERELRWLGNLVVPGLFDGEHRFRLEATETGTRFVHDEQFRGLLVVPILALVRRETEAGFRAMNEALKARCEAIVRSGGAD